MKAADRITPRAEQVGSLKRSQSLVAANEAVRACYRGLLALSPQSGGSITTLMRVSADGVVSDVEPIGNTDPSLLLMMPCVLNAVRTRRFPPTRSSSLLSYPFVLRSGEVIAIPDIRALTSRLTGERD